MRMQSIEHFQSHLGASQNTAFVSLQSGKELRSALAEFCKSIEEFCDKEMLVSVLLVSDDKKHLVEGAAPSLHHDYNEQVNGIDIGPNVGSCGTAAYCGHSIYVVDIETDERWKNFKELALKHGLKACWSVPLISSDKELLGTLAMYYRECRTPTDFEREVIEHAASVASTIIERSYKSLSQ